MDALKVLSLIDNLVDALDSLNSVDQNDAIELLDAVDAVQAALDALDNAPVESEIPTRNFAQELKDLQVRFKAVEEKNAKTAAESIITPESIHQLIMTYNNQQKEELLNLIKTISPLKFEELSVLVLGHLLYEGLPLSEFRKNLQQSGKTGDGGIDGIVTKNDRIRGKLIYYVQSKRYTTNNVQRPDIQKFIGALAPKHASTGVFITTSSFSSGAKEYAKSIPQYAIKLIDGVELVDLMIDYDIGVRKIKGLSMLEIDRDFFIKEEYLLYP